VLSSTDNTPRYETFVGFAIFSLRAIFARGKQYALRSVRDFYLIALERSDDISHEQGESIACARQTYRFNKKREDKSVIKPICPLSFVCVGFVYFCLAHPIIYSTDQMQCSHLVEFLNFPQGTSLIWSGFHIGFLYN